MPYPAPTQQDILRFQADGFLVNYPWRVHVNQRTGVRAQESADTTASSSR